ncbi:hypothetical protein HPB49_022238 [Dermacentor silvarum]|uniref:Uncharacterized protein n=1 Tax=Dermacentor silvarum TaxID=543639 RepID=A0ACB8CN26_DERSI|nr:hypothetical protein HPB49_022238 [Dermacentor silvarum]
MGIYNTESELFQAHYMNQVIRLARTKAGRTTLEALGINPPTEVASKRSLPPEWQQDIVTRPLPRNMHPVHHENRRAARAKAYDKYSDQAGVFFVDAAGPLHYRSTATVVHRGQVVDCTSATGIDITAMEEAGIALAMRNPRATFVLMDSQAAYRNFARGQVGHLAHSILQQAAANRQEACGGPNVVPFCDFCSWGAACNSGEVERAAVEAWQSMMSYGRCENAKATFNRVRALSTPKDACVRAEPEKMEKDRISRPVGRARPRPIVRAA